MKLKHIDNSFFRLTAQQAKKLSIEGRLPKVGYEIRADPAKLASVELLRADGWPCVAKATESNLYRAQATLPANGWKTAPTDYETACSAAKRFVSQWAEVGVLARAAVFYRDGSCRTEFGGDGPELLPESLLH